MHILKGLQTRTTALLQNKSVHFFVLVLLLIHTYVRHFLLKGSIIKNLEEDPSIQKLTALMYCLVYGFYLLAALATKSRTPKLSLNIWLLIVGISFSKEFLAYFTEFPEYSLIDSSLYGSGLYSIKITLSLLLLMVWESLGNVKSISTSFLNIAENAALVNALCIVLGVFIGNAYFESYPMSERWGYSGFLSRGYNIIFSSIFLMRGLRAKHFSAFKSSIFSIALLCSGTKAGILAIGLIFLFVIIKSNYTRRIIIGLGGLLVISFPKWIHYVISWSTFWGEVYNHHGAWDIFFSLRNQKAVKLKEAFYTDYDLSAWLIGKTNIDPRIVVESLPFDYFVFFGLIGSVAFGYFFLKWIPSWKTAIPLLIASAGGWYMLTPFAFIVWSLWINEEKRLIQKKD